MSYKLTAGGVQRLSDGTDIPPAPTNRHWVEYQAWLAAGNTPDPADFEPARAQDTVSDRQFFQALALAKVITTAEALDAVKTGEIPAALQTVVDSLPANQKFAAEMLISGATTFQRSHPLTEMLRAGMGWTAEQLDELWSSAAAL